MSYCSWRLKGIVLSFNFGAFSRTLVDSKSLFVLSHADDDDDDNDEEEPKVQPETEDAPAVADNGMIRLKCFLWSL